MQVTNRIAASLALVLGLLLSQTGGVAAQELKQIKLTAAQVESFIAAQKDLSEMHKKLPQSPGPGDKPDAKVQGEYESIAKKHGFANFAALDDIGANISLVYSGIDPQSGQFTDPVTMIKKEMEEIKADKQIPEKDKKQMLDELTEALKSTPALQFPENVDLVKTFREKLEAVMQ